MSYRILAGDCVARMGMMEASSIDNCITDPPYEIGFMSKGWDNTGVAYNPKTWRAVHRVLKPNGFLAVFAATRTQHRIAHAIERAGFEIIDIISWCYGTGFPKSHNISKALDKSLGGERQIIGKIDGMGYTKSNVEHGAQTRTHTTFDKFSNEPVTSKAKQWEGWGTALKPAYEPIIIARKKDSKRTVNYSQFHYISKASKKEKNAGLTDKNTHPTVKPIAIMKALIEDFTDEESIVFDPFTGSGSTGIATVMNNRTFIGCELTPEYIPIAKARIEHWREQSE